MSRIWLTISINCKHITLNIIDPNGMARSEQEMQWKKINKFILIKKRKEKKRKETKERRKQYITLIEWN